MNIAEELFKGIAIIIDDAFDRDNDPEKNDHIHKIESFIKAKHIPIISYNYIPNIKIVEHINGINFILLDWELYSPEISSNVGASHIKQEKKMEVIEFIKNIKKKYFLPIFIFTKADIENVKKDLAINNLYDKNNIDLNYIFIKRKSDIIKDNDIFKTLEDWITNNPAIYTLKKWETEYNRAKNRMFIDFFNLNSSWPIVLWEAYKKDEVDMSDELGNIVTKNISAILKPYNFNEKYYKRKGDLMNIKNDDIIKIIEHDKFLINDNLNIEIIKCGDVFKFSGKYYLNIRPDCDCIPRNNIKRIDDIELYLIKGDKISSDKIKKLFDNKYGLLKEKETSTIIYPIDNGSAVEFKFKNIIIKNYSEIKDKRKGRIIFPYITNILRKYSLYFQRVGLSRIPKHAIGDISE